MPLYCERAAISSLIKRNIFLFFLQNKHPFLAMCYSKEHRIRSSWFFVCLFVCGFTSHSRILHSYGHKHYSGRASNIDLYSAFSSIEQWVGSLPCHTYCDTFYAFIMVILEDPEHSHLFQMIETGTVTTCVNDLSLSRLSFKSRSLTVKAMALPLSHRGGSFVYLLYKITEEDI